MIMMGIDYVNDWQLARINELCNQKDIPPHLIARIRLESSTFTADYAEKVIEKLLQFDNIG